MGTRMLTSVAASALWLQCSWRGAAAEHPDLKSPASMIPSPDSVAGTPPDVTLSAVIDAYIYGYPILLMDQTRKSFLCEPNVTVNAFQHVYETPDDTFTTIVSPNVDTLYSSAFLDLTYGPILLDLPPTGGRYQLAALFDAWTNNFAGVSSLDLDDAGGSFAIAAEGWRGRLPAGAKRINAPTPLVWLLIRTQVAGPDDVPAANAAQNAMTLKKIGRRGKDPAPPNRCTDTPPPDTVAAMGGVEFFARLAALVDAQGALLPGDEPQLESMAPLGVGPYAKTSVKDLSLADKAQLQTGARIGSGFLDFLTNSPVLADDSGWAPNPNTPLGDYGTDYLLRAIIARVGFGANRNEFAVYQSTATDSRNITLTGTDVYTLTFPPGELPPVKGFWSVTVYTSEKYLAANELGRYALGSVDPLEAAKDGSVTLALSHERPEGSPAANWLPVPAAPFDLTLRMYGPTEAIFSGGWTAPRPVRQRPCGEGPRRKSGC